MWVKLTGEFLNLDHVVRAKVNRAFRNGQDEWVVELESILKNELQHLTRYRGLDADVLIHALNLHSQLEPIATSADVQEEVGKNTLHDVRMFLSRYPSLSASEGPTLSFAGAQARKRQTKKGPAISRRAFRTFRDYN